MNVSRLKPGRRGRSARIAAAGGVALAAAACASAPPSYEEATITSTVYPGADRLFRNGYVDATRPLLRANTPPAAIAARTLAAYEGIDGARLAHQVYDEAQAERLDGACERYVKIRQGESLYDISQLCDIPVYMLMEENPQVPSPRAVHAGQSIGVPYVINYDRLGYADEAGIVNAAATYIVQPGDSLSKIALQHLAPAASIANLNPDVDWTRLPVGAAVRIPASFPAGVVATRPGVPSVKPIYSYIGDGEFGSSGRRDRDGVRDSEISKLMPYRLGPVGSKPGAAGRGAGVLAVDKSFVAPGSAVWVSAEGLPANSDVTIASGPNGNQLREVETVTTGADGTLNARVRVNRRADAGGVVVTATIDDTGEVLYSERIGVLAIDGDESGDDADESED